MPEEIICNICGSNTTVMEVKEQMLGLNESFFYYSCTNCGHTHLNDIPENIGKYYNTDAYYSFKKTKNNGIKNAIQKILFTLKVTDNFFFSHSLKAFLKTNRTGKDLHILDYGCGSGYFVNDLNKLGFKNAMGFDPFLPANKFNNNRIYLSNKLELLGTKKWDIITLNHVFEHLNNPIQTLKNLNDLLNLKGLLILRFPVIDSSAFEKYKENWVQFDAPRHLNIFTRKSIMIAVEKAGNFNLLKMYDDSFHFQFTGSELYLKNRSLNPNNNNRRKRLLSFSTYKYHFLAKKLNKLNKGDQIVVMLEKN